VTDLINGNDFTKHHGLIAPDKSVVNIRIHFGSHKISVIEV